MSKASKPAWRRFVAREFLGALLREGAGSVDAVAVEKIPADLDRLNWPAAT